MAEKETGAITSISVDKILLIIDSLNEVCKNAVQSA